MKREKTAATAIRQRGQEGQGRPTLLNPELTLKLCNMLHLGVPRTVAATQVGLSVATFYQWMVRGDNEESGIYVEFRRLVIESENKAHIGLVAEARKKNPCWLLSRRFPKEWGDKVEVQGNIQHAHLHVIANQVIEGNEESELIAITSGDGKSSFGDS